MRHCFSYASYKTDAFESMAKAMLAGFIADHDRETRILSGGKKVWQALKKIREFVNECLLL